MSKFNFGFLALFCALFVAACAPELNPTPLPIPDGNLGAIQVSAIFSDSARAKLTADPLDVERVAVSITWADGETPPVNMTKTGPVSYNIVIENLPALSPLQVQAAAYDANNELLFTGLVSNFQVLPDATSDLLINLLSVILPDAAGSPPKIIAIRKPLLPVYVGSIFPIEIDVQDPDDSELQFSLTASAGQFSPSAGSSPLVIHQATIASTFTAPSLPGTANLTIRVTDEAGFSSVYHTSMTVLAIPPPIEDTGGANGSVNFAPAILSIDLSMNGNQSLLQVLANVADDQALNELSYSWLINGAAAGISNPISTASNSGIVEVSLTVSDAHGAASTVIFDVNTASTGVADLPISNQPPVLVAAFLSQQNVSYGDVVTATLYATDPEHEQLTAAWSANWGTVLSSENTSDGSYSVHRANWTGGTEVGSAILSAAISDPQGGLVLYSFDIHQILGRVALTAQAGNNQSVFLGQNFTLDGLASASDDGQIETYHWQQTSGPASTIQTPNAAQTSVTPTTAGTYVYQLTATNINNSASDSVSISVSDPTAFAFTEADRDNNGIVYLLDVVNRKVHRYSMPARAWISSLETVDVVSCMAVAPAGDVVYTGVAGGRIDVFNCATGVRSTFSQSTATIDRMVVADAYLFFQDIVGSVESRGLFNRSNGNRTAYATVSYRSNGFVFSSVAGKVFQLRDGVSPNDILQTTINQANGTLGSLTDSPYHGDYSFSHPLRLFPDQSKVTVGSGVYFSTINLNFAGSIGNSYVDLCFKGDQPCIIKATGSDTQLLFLAVDFSIERIQVVPGAPLRVFVWQNDVFVVSTQGTNNIRLTVVEPSN